MCNIIIERVCTLIEGEITRLTLKKEERKEKLRRRNYFARRLAVKARRANYGAPPPLTPVELIVSGINAKRARLSGR